MTTSDLTRERVDRGTSSRPGPLAAVLLAVLRLYRLTAAWRTPRCRYLPTCSTYAVEAIETHGAWRGAGLALRRVGRCHPWRPGGLDPVPPRKADA